MLASPFAFYQRIGGSLWRSDLASTPYRQTGRVFYAATRIFPTSDLRQTPERLS